MRYSGRRQNLRIRYVILLFIILQLISGCGEFEQKGTSELRFAFIGDIHYHIPDYTVGQYFVPQAAKELAGLNPQPAFVIQTGDFLNGWPNEDTDSEAKFAFNDFKKIGIPFFVARGNHDLKGPFEKYGLPFFSQQLEQDISKSYYSFDKENCHFIFLDCMDEELHSQLAWLENDLKKSSENIEIKHTFVAGHFPLWPVARAGFTRPEYANPVAVLLAKYNVDAYFCGHTHNHSTTVRTINGTPLTQIMGAAVVDKAPQTDLAPSFARIQSDPEKIYSKLIPLREAHNILVPKKELIYYWGYQEGSNSSYFVITVNDLEVQVDFYVLGMGHVRSFKWENPGELVNLKEPAPLNAEKIKDVNLNNILEAWLYIAPFSEQKLVKIPFTINGAAAGIVDLSNTINDYSPFWDKMEVPINKSALVAIKKDNRIRFSINKGTDFAFAHTFLLIKLKDGRYAKSTISENVFANFQLSRTANFAPSDKWIQMIEKGQDIEDVVKF
jgi:predicted phosphodiesterase